MLFRAQFREVHDSFILKLYRTKRVLVQEARVHVSENGEKMGNNDTVQRIDCDTPNPMPDDPKYPRWTPVSDWHHVKGGEVTWDAERLWPYYPVDVASLGKQQFRLVGGRQIQNNIVGLPVANANILDFMLENPSKIPAWCEDITLYFWATQPVERLKKEVFVRYLYFRKYPTDVYKSLYGQYGWCTGERVIDSYSWEPNERVALYIGFPLFYKERKFRKKKERPRFRALVCA